MSSSQAPLGWPSTSMQDSAQHRQQDFAAAESLLQHSRTARNHSTPAMDAFATSMPPASVDQAYALDPAQAPLMDANVVSPVQYQTQFNNPSFQPPLAPQEHVPQPFHASLVPTPPTPDLQGSYDPRVQAPQAQQAQGHTAVVSSLAGQGSHGIGHVPSNGRSASGSESQSPIVQKDAQGTSTFWTSAGKPNIKHEVDERPAWSEMKTKAGKERKRLPLACIACRRKKIKCSGEKPTCAHCGRLSLTCVYKITTRRALPRTDYMAMLDRRLRRMEDRVVKITPKDEEKEGPLFPKAILKPSAGTQNATGKKRAAEEAFGPQLEQWALTRTSAYQRKGKKADEHKANQEGVEHLPSIEMQEHLSEVFFDCLYGQSYHLLHKPSYMRRLR